MQCRVDVGGAKLGHLPCNACDDGFEQGRAGPTRGLLVAILSWRAEQERARRIERTKAGMARAKRQGTRSGRKIGRPKVRVDVDAARAAMAAGASQRAAAAGLGVSLATLQRALARTA